MKTLEELQEMTAKEIYNDYIKEFGYSGLIGIDIKPEETKINLNNMVVKDLLQLLNNNPNAILRLEDKSEGICNKHFHYTELNLVTNIDYDKYKNKLVKLYLTAAKRKSKKVINK